MYTEVGYDPSNLMEARELRQAAVTVWTNAVAAGIIAKASQYPDIVKNADYVLRCFLGRFVKEPKDVGTDTEDRREDHDRG